MDQTLKGSSVLRPIRPERRSSDAHDWKKAAPRWFLLAVIVVGAALLGALYQERNGYQAREQQRLENALLDAPTKYQARLSERVAVVEHQNEVLSKAVTDLTIQVREQVKASLELTYQMERLTAELKKGNKSG
jgi:hypothetical protein